MLYILNEQTYDLSPVFSENLLENGRNVVKTTFVNSKNEKFYLISTAAIAEVFFDGNHVKIDSKMHLKEFNNWLPVL